MARGNHNRPIHPLQSDVPKQKGQGQNTPKGNRAARQYSGGKATGSPDKPAKSSRM